MGSPFEVLGVAPEADDETVKQAYRERVKAAHPDQGGSVEEFREIRTAYEKIRAGYEPGDDGPQLDSAETDAGGGATDSTGETGAAASGEAEADDAGESRRYRVESKITYLNYEAVTDHGWAVDDDDLFEKAADADLAEEDYGQFMVEPGETLLEGAESRGFAWPFACRGGACVNCAVMLAEGELSMPVNHILPPEMMEQNIRLSCNGLPITDELKVVYNVKHLPMLEELLLPPRPFEQAHATD